MRFPSIAATLVALSLIACNGPEKPASGLGPENTPVETPEYSEPSPSAAPWTPKSPENTLIETSEYTGVVISRNGASEFGYLFDEASTGFWEPSVNEISRAEKCIRQLLDSVQDDPELGAYPKEDAAFILNNLEKYRRQYVGIVVDGEKRIWVNSFLSDDSLQNWRRVPVDVDDGGNRFWQIEYDMLKDECTNFRIHGEA